MSNFLLIFLEKPGLPSNSQVPVIPQRLLSDIDLSNGELIEELQIDDHPEGLSEFFERMEFRQRRYPGAVSVAMVTPAHTVQPYYHQAMLDVYSTFGGISSASPSTAP